MPTTSQAPRSLAAERSPWLRGLLSVPGDPAIAHLALVVAAVSRGESILAGIADTSEVASAVAALSALGARLDRHGERWIVHGAGTGLLLEPREPLDLGSSAIGLELLLGLVSTHGFPVRFTGGPDLASRTFRPLLDGLRRFGAEVTADERARLPIAIRGPRLATQVALDLPAAGQGTKAALLLAALNALGTSSFTDRAGGPDHAERLLADAGAAITVAPAETGRTIEIAGFPDLKARQASIPADPSISALGAVAGSIVPGSDIRIEGVLVNPARTSILSALVAMGAAIEVRNLHTSGGEQVADIAVRSAALRGISLAAHFVGPLIPDLPALAVAAAFAEGETVLNLPPALGYDERGRLAALVRGLTANGIACDITEETLAIAGAAEVPGGAAVVTAGDPALSMAFLVLGMAAKDQVTIEGGTGIEERFPRFVEAFESVGASFIRNEDR